MRSKIKRGISLLIILGLAITCFACLSACNRRQVPIYEGMEITKRSETASLGDVKLTAKGDFSEGVTGDLDGGDNGEGEDKLPDNPFPEGGTDMEDAVDSSISVEGAEEDMYHTIRYSNVYIKIKINNPDKYEILSFTLGGEKYSDYMFEEGSDLENIIIKINTGTMGGVVEYTIDAMKYIDENNEIKDVIMAGDKTVKVGIRTNGQVEGDVESFNVTENSVSCSAVVYDAHGLIKYFGGKAFAVVYDGEKIIGFRELSGATDENGEVVSDPRGDVTLSGLHAGRVYQFGIVAFYDGLDGEGFGPKVVYSQSFRTDSIVSFDSFKTEKDGAAFSFAFGEGHGPDDIISLSLYRGEERISALATDAGSVAGLLSGVKYRLVAEYKNAGKTESVYAEFTTREMAAPAFDDLTVDLLSDTLSVSYGCTDEDGVVTEMRAELLSGGVVIAEGENGKLTKSGLAESAEYLLKITYKYDMNDGEGVRTHTVERSLKTAPYFNLTSLRVLNTENLFAGDTVYFQAAIDNPSSLDIISVTVNGTVCPAQQAGGRLYFELTTSSRAAEGMTEFTVERVTVRSEDCEFAVRPREKLSASLFVNLMPVLSEVYLADGEGTRTEYTFFDEGSYLALDLDNMTDYRLTEVTTSIGRITEGIISLGDGIFLLPIKPDTGWQMMTVSGFKYQNDRISAEVSDIRVASDYVYVVSGGINYISSAEELATLGSSEGGYYELTADIDLSEVLWKPTDFNGVLNGRGHTVSGLSLMKTYMNEDTSTGLFARASGVITGLNIEDFYVKVSLTGSSGYHLRAGILAGSASGRLSVSDCTVDGSSYINASSTDYETVAVGGLIGFASSITVRNCSSGATVSGGDISGGIIAFVEHSWSDAEGYAKIVNSRNTGEVTGATAGGIVGVAFYNETMGEVLIFASENDGAVTAERCVGGILGKCKSVSVISDCVNRGEVTVTGGVNDDTLYDFGAGGIAGYINSGVRRCQNLGKVTGVNSVGGIVGAIGPCELAELLNCGEVAGKRNVGGIVGCFRTAYQSYPHLHDLENRGDVSGDTNVGGIAGGGSQYQSEVVIERCVNSGDVYVKTENGGGIIGSVENYVEFRIESCINLGRVVGGGEDDPVRVGGIVGKLQNYSTAYIVNCIGLGEPDENGVYSDKILAYYAYIDFLATEGNVTEYDETLDSADYYLALGFDAEVWRLSELDLTDGGYPTLIFE